jgi:phosphatidylinositol alpha-1,6-mannosyltransferase
VSRTLVVTNDFPPRPGGIQTFVHELVRRQGDDSVVVYTSQWRGAEEFDAAQPFPVIRHHGRVLLPTPAVGRRAASLLRTYGCDRVLFGAAAPLGLLARGLHQAGARRVVGLTHGHEAGWAGLPGTAGVVRRVGARVDVLTYLGEYTRARIASALAPEDRDKLVRLTPGVDEGTYRPDVDGSSIRARHDLGERPVVLCVSRLMPRKGQDTLIRVLPELCRAVPGVALLLVGGGPYRDRLVKLAAGLGVADAVVFTGSVPAAELPLHYAASDVFAMPCRTRNRGLDVEGLGIVYLEASATGLPVVAGDSGGAPDAVREGETGYVVPGRDVQALTDRLTELLLDPALAARLGRAGRAWVEQDWRWDVVAARLGHLLDPDRPLQLQAEDHSG